MSAAIRARDSQRSRVYSAEQQLRWLRDNGCDTAEIDGVMLQLEPEARFADLDSISRYVGQVLAMPALISRYGTQQPVSVRFRKGSRKAHYEYGTRTIAVHTDGNRFAMREIAVLHELAHALTSHTDGHGPRFTATMLDLLEIVIGPQTALALRMIYAANGVRVG